MSTTNKQDEKKPIVNNTNEDTQKIKGVDNSLVDQANTSFADTPDTNGYAEKQAKADNALGAYENITNEQIVSTQTKEAINQTFNKTTEVLQADAYIKTQLGKIQSGKTSYSDKVQEMMSKIEGRDKFSYDVDSDPLFQQALASAMNSGKSAMQDTIGQASALTGGYGSTYATSAANQAYNAFIEDAYDNLPQYYQMAMEAYQMEGDEMYRQLGMYNDADDKEYNRLLTAYDATYQHRNQVYNEAYQQFRDSKSDAFASANLQIAEHGQRASDAYNLYSAYANIANTAYDRNYQQWADSINQVYQMMGVQQTDYWKNEEYEQKEYWNQQDMDYKEDALAEEQRQFNITHGDTDGNGDLSSDEIKTYNTQAANGLNLSKTQLDAAKSANEKAGGGEAGYEAAVNELKAMGITIDATNERYLMDVLSGGATTTTTPIKTGNVKGFDPAKDGYDNFDIEIGGKHYRVENHGEVTDADTLNELKKINVSNEKAFVYDGQIYMKYAVTDPDGNKTDKYYKVGHTNILGHKTKGYQNAYGALTEDK